MIDTNVVVAGISGFRDQYVQGRIPSADLMYRWADDEHFTWLYTEDILMEYKEVLRRLHVRPALIGAFINLIRERGEAVEIRSQTEVSPDPKDDPFCACSEAGRADMILTLNPKDFPQSRLKARVLAPTRYYSNHPHPFQIFAASLLSGGVSWRRPSTTCVSSARL